MAKTPDRRTRQAQALRENLKRRKEQERRRQDAGEAPAPPSAATVDKAKGQEGEVP